MRIITDQVATRGLQKLAMRTVTPREPERVIRVVFALPALPICPGKCPDQGAIGFECLGTLRLWNPRFSSGVYGLRFSLPRDGHL